MTSSTVCLWLLYADGHSCLLQAASAKNEPGAGGKGKKKKRKAKVSCRSDVSWSHLSAALLTAARDINCRAGWTSE